MKVDAIKFLLGTTKILVGTIKFLVSAIKFGSADQKIRNGDQKCVYLIASTVIIFIRKQWTFECYRIFCRTVYLHFQISRVLIIRARGGGCFLDIDSNINNHYSLDNTFAKKFQYKQYKLK